MNEEKNFMSTSEKLKRFLKRSKNEHDELAVEWDSCQEIYQAVSKASRGLSNIAFDSSQAIEELLNDNLNIGEEEEIELSTLKAVKATLFLQSKLAISDPTVTVSALTSSQDDRRAAEFATHFVRYFRRHTNLDEALEHSVYLNCACLGTGFLYVGWDGDRGELGEDGTPKGDFVVEGVSPRDIFLDPDVSSFEEQWRCVRKREVGIDQLLASFPESKAKILQYFKKQRDAQEEETGVEEDSDTLTVYEYWESAKPWNNFQGKLMYFVNFEDPMLLCKPQPNPYEHKELPFHILTDVDISENVWGMSRLVLASTSFDALSNIYSVVLANAMLHGQIRLLYPNGELPKEILNDNAIKAIPYSPYSGAKAEHLKPTTVSGDFWALKNSIDQDINDLYGMNEFSQGQVGRELSSYTVQMAIEMDDKFRVRLFNKKKRMIQRLYRNAIQLAKQYVGDARYLEVVGPEQSDELISFKGSNLRGNYTLTVDYGMFLPADPAARKNQLIELLKMGVFQEAGMDIKKLIGLLVDGDMLDVKNYLEGARKVQDAENQKMVNGIPVSVEKYHEHKEHLASLVELMNTQEFESYDPEVKKMFIAHKEEHTKALAALKAKSAKSASPGEGGAKQPQPIK